MKGTRGRLAAGALLALTLLAPRMLDAQGSTLTLSGDPQALVISSAVAGFGPDPVTDEGTTYSVVAEDLSRITGQLDAPLPTGVTLLVRLEPPTGALGQGWVTLGTTAQVLVSSILPGTYSGLGIQYQLRATVAAGVVPLGSRAVTFTVEPGQ